MVNKPRAEYQRVISAAVFGLLLLVSGFIGWDLRWSHGWFRGTRWVEGQVWWEIAVGAGLLLISVFLAGRGRPGGGAAE